MHEYTDQKFLFSTVEVNIFWVSDFAFLLFKLDDFA